MSTTEISMVEVQVITGPETVQVDVDFGPQGNPGSQFYVSLGNPNDSLSSQVTPALRDLCVNTFKNDPEYSYIYQYQVNNVGVAQWEPIIKLNPSIHAQKLIGTFTAGSKTFYLDLSQVVDSGTIETLDKTNFSIQYSIEGSTPIASSMLLGDINTDNVTGVKVLPITITAKEFTTSWINLEGTKTVNILVSVV
jgi:hypothetical protein